MQKQWWYDKTSLQNQTADVWCLKNARSLRCNQQRVRKIQAKKEKKKRKNIKRMKERILYK